MLKVTGTTSISRGWDHNHQLSNSSTWPRLQMRSHISIRKHPVQLEQWLQEQGVFGDVFVTDWSWAETNEVLCWDTSKELSFGNLKPSGCSQGWLKWGSPQQACKVTSPFSEASVFICLADRLGNQANVDILAVKSLESSTNLEKGLTSACKICMYRAGFLLAPSSRTCCTVAVVLTTLLNDAGLTNRHWKKLTVILAVLGLSQPAHSPLF